jgi:hypothetical protein
MYPTMRRKLFLCWFKNVHVTVVKVHQKKFRPKKTDFFRTWANFQLVITIY